MRHKVLSAVAAKTDWHASDRVGAPGYDVTKNNSSGYSGLPAGYRSNEGLFFDLGIDVNWWSATEIDASATASIRTLDFNYDPLFRNTADQRCGFSCRLLKD